MQVSTIELHLGDGVAGVRALPPRSVDHVIADPPFDVRTHRAALESGDWRNGDRLVDAALPFDPLSPEQLEEVAAELARVARRWIVLFCAERQIESWASALERHGARFVRLGLAVRRNPRPQQSGDRPGPAADQIVIAHAGVGGHMRWNGRGRPARWDAPEARWETGGTRVHPTQKAVALYRQLLEDFTDAGELVLDPFAGSASLALACVQTGRRFLGWELRTDYHATGTDRIAAELASSREQLGLDYRGRA